METQEPTMSIRDILNKDPLAQNILSRKFHFLGDRVRDIMSECVTGACSLHRNDTAAVWGRANVSFTIKSKTVVRYNHGRDNSSSSMRGNDSFQYDFKIEARISNVIGTGDSPMFSNWDPMENEGPIVIMVMFNQIPVSNDAKRAFQLLDDKKLYVVTFDVSETQKVEEYIKERFDRIFASILMAQVEDISD